MKMLIGLFTILLLSSCGKDLLSKSAQSTSKQAVTNKECSGYVPSKPVCALLPSDNSLHDYFSADYAQCLGAEVQSEGHCDCSANTIDVCTVEAASVSECEAKSKKYTITKYTPCFVKDF